MRDSDATDASKTAPPLFTQGGTEKSFTQMIRTLSRYMRQKSFREGCSSSQTRRRPTFEKNVRIAPLNAPYWCYVKTRAAASCERVTQLFRQKLHRPSSLSGIWIDGFWFLCCWDTSCLSVWYFEWVIQNVTLFWRNLRSQIISRTQ